MARPCAVCIHPSRSAIETAILNRKAVSAIARDFGFTYTRSKDKEQVPDHRIVTRHRDQHMGAAYQTAVEEAESQAGVAIAKRLEDLDDHVNRVLAEAWKGRPVLVADVPLLNDDGQPVLVYDLRLVLAAVKEARGNAELLAKLSGRTEQDPQDLETIRRHLQSPEARRLMAQLEAMAAAQDHGTGTQARP